MPTDYEKVKRDNIEEYGKGTRHLEFLGRLYSDRTHFIYELLQNAEDARASKVAFLLEPGRLVFKHDGKEMFNEKHVRGVCGVAEGTKAEDETKIGKFGIGFKSVYAYTRTPEIHCGDEHFRIEHFVRPTAADQIAVDSPGLHSSFSLSLRKPALPRRRRSPPSSSASPLSGFTHFFSSAILREIQWEVTGGAKGVYRSHKTPSPKHRRVNLKAYSDTAPGASAPQVAEDWLLFNRPLSIPGKPSPSTSKLLSASLRSQNREGINPAPNQRSTGGLLPNRNSNRPRVPHPGPLPHHASPRQHRGRSMPLNLAMHEPDRRTYRRGPAHDQRNRTPHFEVLTALPLKQTSATPT